MWIMVNRSAGSEAAFRPIRAWGQMGQIFVEGWEKMCEAGRRSSSRSIRWHFSVCKTRGAVEGVSSPSWHQIRDLSSTPLIFAPLPSSVSTSSCLSFLCIAQRNRCNLHTWERFSHWSLGCSWWCLSGHKRGTAEPEQRLHSCQSCWAACFWGGLEDLLSFQPWLLVSFCSELWSCWLMSCVTSDFNGPFCACRVSWICFLLIHSSSASLKGNLLFFHCFMDGEVRFEAQKCF